MNKKIIAAAVAATFAVPAFADGNAMWNGAIRQSVDIVDIDGGADNVQINDRLSNLKVSGSEDLGNGMKAVFSAQWFLNISGPSATSLANNPDEFGSTAAWSHGNAYVGLAGDFGTVVVGRHDHPVKMSTGRLDIFANTVADNVMTFQNGADLRANGTVAYISPSFSGLTIAAAVVPGENNTADGIADAYSVAAMYSNGGIYASLGYEEGDEGLDNAAATAGDYEQLRAGLGYTMDALHVNVVYTDVETNGADAYDSWKIAGKYTMGNNAIKAQYWQQDFDGAEEEDGFAIGLDHNFSKRTQAQLNYVAIDDNGGTSGADQDVFSIQLNHSF